MMDAPKSSSMSYFILCISICCVGFLNTEEIPDENDQQQTQTFDPVQLYRRLLRQKREDQLAAVKQMQAIESEEKQRKMAQLMLSRICTVLAEKKVELMEAGYMPGDAFPTDDHVKDALSSVAENTALLGDIILRAPDPAHALLGQNPDWTLLARWSVSFMNESAIYEKREQTLLNLMAQELNIAERDPNYVNPYKQEAQIDKLADEIIREAERERKKEEKKEKRKKQRGPRLAGGGGRTEL